MKYFLIFVLLILSCQNVFALDYTRIAVVDMQKLMNSSSAASAIKEHAKKEWDAYQALISSKEEKLRKEEIKLQEQRAVITKEAFSNKARKFKDKVAKMQRDFQEKRASQDVKLKKALNKINQAVFQIIHDLARQEGFDLALPRSQILYTSDTLDITDQVITRLNKNLPKVKD